MKHPPYHLRTNKAVERLLLVDILRAFNPTEEYTYYSLAGPFLEDLRVMDHFFPHMRLISLESNEQTFKRQQFHQFSSRIELRRRTLTDFLRVDYEPGGKDVFWLDYTDLKYQNLQDFQVALQRAEPGSIVKITMRAEPEIDLEILEDSVSEIEIEKIRNQIEANFKKEFQRVLPRPLPSAFAMPKEYATMVQMMIRRAASTALDTAGSTKDFLHVQSTRYNDNTQMMSVTGVIYNRSEYAEMCDTLRNVRIKNFAWQEPDEINIPALSMKESLHLERHLPIQPGEDAGDMLSKILAYKIDNSAKMTKQKLSQYADYYRDYPNFVRISI